MYKIILLVLLAEVCTGIGQICFKKSVNNLGGNSSRASHTKPFFFRKLFVKPMLWAGIVSMALGLIFWISALSLGDLSIVYPLGSIQYVFVLFASHFFLGETISRTKLIGTALVILGIVFITLS